MAKFDLDENHRLRSDSRQWILEKRVNVKDGDQVWRIIGYHSSVRTAIDSVYGHMLRSSEAQSFIEFKQDAKRIFDKLVSVLSPIADIREKP